MPCHSDEHPSHKSNVEDYRSLNVGSLHVAYREIGQGDPVLLVHGFGNSSYTWTYVVPKLPKGFRYILLDLPGFGKSDKPKGASYLLEGQACVLARVIESLNLRGAIFIGHSYGGAVGLTYLLLRGGRDAGYIRGCVFIDSPAYQQVLPRFVTRLTMPLLSRLLIHIIPSAFMVRMSLKTDVFFDRTKIPGDLVEAYATALKSHGAKQALLATANNLATVEDSFDLSSRIPTLTLPSLVIWGEEDKIVPLNNGYKLSKDLPNCTLETLSKCGHAPQEECPSRTAEIIGDFLELV